MPNGSLALEASFRLVQDELFEMDLENFTVSVVNSSFSTVSIPMPVTVRIEDTDCKYYILALCLPCTILTSCFSFSSC